MTLKLEDDKDTQKMYLHAENEAASLRHSNLELELEKNTKICRSRRSRSECQELQITSSIIITDILIKLQQFPTSSFSVASLS